MTAFSHGSASCEISALGATHYKADILWMGEHRATITGKSVKSLAIEAGIQLEALVKHYEKIA